MVEARLRRAAVLDKAQRRPRRPAARAPRAQFDASEPSGSASTAISTIAGDVTVIEGIDMTDDARGRAAAGRARGR